MAWIYLFLAITAEIFATSSLKAADGFTRLGPSLLCIVSYALSFYLLSLVLRTIPVGIAYALWSGVGIVCITAIGWFFYGQKLDIPAMIGLGLIMAGVLVINLGSKSIQH